MLTARAENHFRGNPDLDDTIARLQAYEAAGADVLYAPGLANAEEIRAVCDAVSKPVNVLARPGLRMSEIAAAGRPPCQRRRRVDLGRRERHGRGRRADPRRRRLLRPRCARRDRQVVHRPVVGATLMSPASP